MGVQASKPQPKSHHNHHNHKGFILFYSGADPDLWKGGVKHELRHYIVSGLIKKKVTAS